jgi:hypothetical protein
MDKIDVHLAARIHKIEQELGLTQKLALLLIISRVLMLKNILGLED